MDKFTSPLSYFWGVICTLIGALSLNDIAIIVGIILSIATFCINWVYKRRDFQHKKNYENRFMNSLSKIVTNSICSVTVIVGIVLINYRDEIRTSKQGLDLIGNAESCRNKPYYCPANILTIGIGSTTGKIEQRQYSDDEIAARWVSDIKQAEQCVNQYASGALLPQSVFDATVSITFNVGCTKMKTSTMYRYLSNGYYQAACNELLRWNKSAGKVLNGLVIRREKERELCLLNIV